VLLLIVVASCGKPPPEDPYCSYGPLPAGAEVASGQGALQVEGSHATYFYALDETGKQIGYGSMGKALGLAPGKYQSRVNGSLHPVTVQKGSLTKCSTATVAVPGETGEYYYVLDSTGRQLHYNTLGKASSLWPGPYRIKVNNTHAQAEAKLDQVAEIGTGTLLVHGATEEYYYVLDSAGEQLAYNTLGKPLALLPGTYNLKVNNTASKADIAAGQAREVRTGGLLVKGTTEEYYYVLDSLGQQLAYQNLNKALALFPGGYRLSVNKSESAAEVVAEQMLEAHTGSLIVEGTAGDYYYVLDRVGNQLGYNGLGKALSFFPGDYTVKFGQSQRPASLRGGQRISVRF
jgi:6,7-dimethyl-8-ribityllumazine synthase